MPQVTCVAYFTVKLKVVFSAYKKNLQVTFILRWGYGAKMQKNVRDTFINYVCFSLVPQKCERTCFFLFLKIVEHELNSWILGIFKKKDIFSTILVFFCLHANLAAHLNTLHIWWWCQTDCYKIVTFWKLILQFRTVYIWHTENTTVIVSVSF